ncbi:hypothetical protein [Weissella cibaria]|uniref:hypothetical protein n=1 Tax=Weissella cibaria TaxID=137591 RepID=UPI0036DA8A45
MIYAVSDIALKIAPIAKEFDVKKMILFGSYARGKQQRKATLIFCINMKDQKLKVCYLWSAFDRLLNRHWVSVWI